MATPVPRRNGRVAAGPAMGSQSPALGGALGAALFSAVMAILLATGTYALTGPTAVDPWLPLADSSEGAVEELIFRGAIFRLLSSVFGMWGRSACHPAYSVRCT
jgi:hypothetical protein